MPEREKVFTVVGEWVGKAENDLKNAAHTLKLGADCPTDTVCFHAQQVVVVRNHLRPPGNNARGGRTSRLRFQLSLPAHRPAR